MNDPGTCANGATVVSTAVGEEHASEVPAVALRVADGDVAVVVPARKLTPVAGMVAEVVRATCISIAVSVSGDGAYAGATAVGHDGGLGGGM